MVMLRRDPVVPLGRQPLGHLLQLPEYEGELSDTVHVT